MLSVKSKTLARQEERADQSKAMAVHNNRSRSSSNKNKHPLDLARVSWIPNCNSISIPPTNPARCPTTDTCQERKSNDKGAVVLFWLTILILVGVLLPVLSIIWDEGLIEIGGPVYACLPIGFALTVIFVVTLATIALTLADIWLLSAAANIIIILNYMALWLLLVLGSLLPRHGFICAFLATIAILLFISIFYCSRQKEKHVFACYLQQASRAVLCHPNLLVGSAISGLFRFAVLFILNFLALQLTRLPTEFCFKAALVAFIACASLWIAAIIGGVSQARLACLFRSIFCGDCEDNCCAGDKFGSIIYAALVAPAFNLLYWVTDDVKPCASLNVLDFVLDNIGSLIFRCAQLGSHYLYIFIGMNGDNFQEASTVSIIILIICYLGHLGIVPTMRCPPLHQCPLLLPLHHQHLFVECLGWCIHRPPPDLLVAHHSHLSPPSLTFGALVAIVMTNVLLESLYNGLGVLEVLWKCCPGKVVGDFSLHHDSSSSDDSSLLLTIITASCNNQVAINVMRLINTHDNITITSSIGHHECAHYSSFVDINLDQSDAFLIQVRII